MNFKIAFFMLMTVMFNFAFLACAEVPAAPVLEEDHVEECQCDCEHEEEVTGEDTEEESDPEPPRGL